MAEHVKPGRHNFTVVAVLVVLLAAITIAAVGSRFAATPEPTPVPSESPQAAPSPSREPSPVAATHSPAAVTSPTVDQLGDELELEEIAWWDTQSMGFGFTGFEPEPVPAVPDGYRQLRVGTLGGQVTAVRTLPDGWSRSYVSGPVHVRGRAEVLVVADDGSSSVVSVIEASTGTEEMLFEADEIVPAAVFSPDGSEIWYVKLERDTGEDVGLWRRPRQGHDESQILSGPLGEPFDAAGVTVWQLLFRTDGRYLMVQWCFGQVRCTTHILDVTTGDVRSTDALGWPFGFTDSLLVTQGLGPAHQRAQAFDLASSEQSSWSSGAFEVGTVVEIGRDWWLVGAQGSGSETFRLQLQSAARAERLATDADLAMTTFHLPYDAGLSPLPEGWVLRWPEPLGTWPEEDLRSRGLLIHVADGDTTELPPFVPEIAAATCPIAAPTETPLRHPVGPSRSELRSGVRYVQWSQDADVVTLAVGTPVIGTPQDYDDMPATQVRGHDARVVLIRDEGAPEIALLWQEGECTYTAWLAPGTTFDEAIDYAGRY